MSDNSVTPFTVMTLSPAQILERYEELKVELFQYSSKKEEIGELDLLVAELYRMALMADR